MNISTTIVCLPVKDLDTSLLFYKNVFDLPDMQIEEGIVTIELPNISIFLMQINSFEDYTLKIGRGVQLPNQNIGMIISCAISSQKEIDTALTKALKYGGSMNEAVLHEELGGYICDPDGHTWELVKPIFT